MHASQPGRFRGAPGSMEDWAPFYDAMTFLLTLGRERKLRQATLDLARVRRGDRILEVGCGTGSLAVEAKRQTGPSGWVVGIDVAPQMVGAARRKAKRNGLDLYFAVARIERIPFADAQFDVVLSSLMMHHMEGRVARQKGLAESLRVLRPGGRLLVVDLEQPQPGSPLAWLTRKHWKDHSMRGLVPLVEEAGFRQVEFGPTPYRVLWFLRGVKGEPQSASAP